MGDKDRKLADWLRGYMEFTSHSESPDQFHFWTGVAAIAGALQRKVWIPQVYYTWTPNFYIILVGPPGVAKKSTSVSMGVSLLRGVPNIKFGPDSMTWQALAAAMEDALSAYKVQGWENGAVKEDVHKMCSITCAVSELGTFLDPRNAELVNFLTDVYDGREGAWDRHTRTQGNTRVENPCVNIIGCTTPAWLRENFPDVLVGGGLTSRILFVYGDRKRRHVAYPALEVDNKKFMEMREVMLHDLRLISEMRGEYLMDKEATDWGTEWYTKLEDNRPANLASERYSGYLSRKQTHVHKLAMVMAASRRDKLIITRNDLQRAEQKITELEKDMTKVFESIGLSQSGKHIEEIINIVRTCRKIEMKKIWNMCRMGMERREFLDAVRGAMEAGYVVGVKTSGRDYLQVTMRKEERERVNQ